MKKRKHFTAMLGLVLALAMILSPVASARVTFEEPTGSVAIFRYSGNRAHKYNYEAGSDSRLSFRVQSSQEVSAFTVIGGVENEDYEILVGSKPLVSQKNGTTKYFHMVSIEFLREGTYTLQAIDANNQELGALEMTIKN